MNLYGTYRMTRNNEGQIISPSRYIDYDLADYKAQDVITMEDMVITDSQYTTERVPGVKSLTRFFKAAYNENYVPTEHLDIVKTKMVANNYATFFDTAEEARTWLNNNTSLVATGDNYELTEAEGDEPAVYLVIE